uniref:Hypermethylated in cancer 1 protein n=2 Tax=Scleropages formosus TaxID=113540 RepID=A0A8C9R325_SCLFO
MIVKGDLDGMAEEFGHPGGGLKTTLDAMEVPSHARHLLLQLNSQRTKGFLCDVIIVVQNALFRAHKNILAASSLYLKSLVVHDNLINLDHEMVSPGVFRVILDYIYTGRLGECDSGSSTEPNLAAVLAAASYLQLLDLVALCRKRLKRNGKYHLRPGFMPYGKIGPANVGLSGGGRFQVSTPVIQPCFPGGLVSTHPSRAPPPDELPHLTTHVGELYAPHSSQGPPIYNSTRSALPLTPGLRPPHPEKGCSSIYGLDLSKKSPTPQSQQVAAHPHLAHAVSHHEEGQGGELNGRDSPMVTANGDPYPADKESTFPSKMEAGEHMSALNTHSFPHLSQSLVPHLPPLHRSHRQDPYPCSTSPDMAGDMVDQGQTANEVYRWVKHEPIPYVGEDDEDEDEEEEGTGERNKESQHQHSNHHKGSEDKLGTGDAGYGGLSAGEDDKSGTGSEESVSSEGRPSPPGRFHLPYEPETFGDNLYVCIPCDKGFPSSEQLNAHVETHTEEEIYSNSGGEVGSSNSTTTNSNNNNNNNGSGGGNHGNGSANSCVNNLSYAEGKACQSLPSVTGLGETIRPYRCSSCEKSYKDPATLRQHEKTHWLTRPYPCSICGKKFTQRGTMTRHMRSHLGLKPFACDACGMRFTRQYRLTEHMRIHSGEKPYECQVCGGKFAQQRNLISHMKMHSVGVGGVAPDSKLKMDFGEGIFPLSKYTAEQLGLKQEDSLFPLSKLAAQHLGLSHDKMDTLSQAPPLSSQQLPPESRTIDRYSPS